MKNIWQQPSFQKVSSSVACRRHSIFTFFFFFVVCNKKKVSLFLSQKDCSWSCGSSNHILVPRTMSHGSSMLATAWGWGRCSNQSDLWHGWSPLPLPTPQTILQIFLFCWHWWFTVVLLSVSCTPSALMNANSSNVTQPNVVLAFPLGCKLSDYAVCSGVSSSPVSLLACFVLDPSYKVSIGSPSHSLQRLDQSSGGFGTFW